MSGPPDGSQRTRVAILAASIVVLSLVAIGYVWLATGDRTRDEPGSTIAGAVTLDAGHRLLVVSNERIASVASSDPAGPRTVSDVACVRVYAANGTGICLRATDPWSYEVAVLDGDLGTVRSFPIPGLPNRARVSPSGRMVAWTSFVGGDSYAGGGFSTRTGILDTRTGAKVMSLEDFAVTRDGRGYRAIDVNVWGVTFTADDNLFYATLATAGQRYLVRGDVTARTLETLATNVECPSLSPDGTRIAFKQAIDANPNNGWRLSVLDLSTRQVTNLAEPASVDDQAAWLDDRTVAYTLRAADGHADVYSVPADGTGAPRLLVPDAESPSAPVDLSITATRAGNER